MPAVRVEGLTKTYGQTIALRGVDFTIEAGEVVAILGPNGAGKTTIIEVLEGFRHPDSGHVEVLGIDPEHRNHGWLDKIGIVFQEGGIEDELTVVEAIAAQRRPYTSPRDVDDVIETVGLGAKRQERIKRLSGGQRRRLDLALGIVGNPELLFLDEPTTGFDPEARRRSWAAIRELPERGATIVLTTHYLEEAQELADRVIVISHGQIVASGSPDQLGDRRSQRATIRFSIESSAAGALGVDADHDGKVAIETEDAVQVINDITTRALRAGLALEGLEITRMSLEDAYLRLVDSDG